MKPTPRDIETFAGYTKELHELTKQLFKDPSASWEVEHRIKIIQEWQTNELKTWTNTED